MANTNRGDEPAFPNHGTEIAGGMASLGRTPGLTKREWLAGMALIGLLSNGADSNSWESAAERSVEVADLLLERLAKSK